MLQGGDGPPEGLPPTSGGERKAPPAAETFSESGQSRPAPESMEPDLDTDSDFDSPRPPGSDLDHPIAKDVDAGRAPELKSKPALQADSELKSQPGLELEPQQKPQPEPEPELPPEPELAHVQTKLQVTIPEQEQGAAGSPTADASAATAVRIFTRLHRWATHASDENARRNQPKGLAAIRRVQRVLDEIIPVLHPGRAVLFLIDRQREAMFPICTIGLDEVECKPYTPGIGIAGEAAISGLASIVSDANHDHRYDAQSDIAAAAAADGMESGSDDSVQDEGDSTESGDGVSVLCLPLFSAVVVDPMDQDGGEQVRAVLQLANSNAHPFQSSDLTLAQHLCAPIGDTLVAEWDHVLSYLNAIPSGHPDALNQAENGKSMLTVAPKAKVSTSAPAEQKTPLTFKKVVTQIMMERTATSLMVPGSKSGGGHRLEQAELDLEDSAICSAEQIIANVLRVASDMVLVDRARFFVVCHSSSQIWPAHFHNKTKPNNVDSFEELLLDDIVPRSLRCGSAAARCAISGKPLITSDDESATATNIDSALLRTRSVTFATRPPSPVQDESDAKGAVENSEQDVEDSQEQGGTTLCSPLFCRGALLGILYFHKDEQQKHTKLFDSDDIMMVAGLCTDVGVALAEGTSTKKISAAMLALAKQQVQRAKNMHKLIGATSVTAPHTTSRPKTRKRNASMPRNRMHSGLSKGSSGGHSGLFGLGKKETPQHDNLTELRNQKYNEGMLLRQLLVAGRALVASRSDVAFALAVAWYCVALPLHLAFADGRMAVQRLTQEEVLDLSPSPSPPSPRGITAIVHSLTDRANATQGSNDSFGEHGDASLESAAFLVVMWLDLLADLVVAAALLQKPKLQPLFDVLTTSVLSERVQRSVCVDNIGVHYESEDILREMFEHYGKVDNVEVHPRIDEDGVTNTSWASVTMAEMAGKEAALDDEARVFPEPISVASLSSMQSEEDIGTAAKERKRTGLRSTWMWKKGAEIVAALHETIQSCVAPDRYGKNGRRGLEQQLRCVCALPFGVVVPHHWVTTVRLLRLAHVPRAAAIGSKWVQRSALHYATVNILRAITLLVLLSHWLGCGFLSMLRNDPHASAWMPTPCYASAQDQYICGVYWAFGTLTSNISFEPHSGRQRVLTILAWCGGLMLYGSILSSLVNTLSNLDRAASAHREHMDTLEEAESKLYEAAVAIIHLMCLSRMLGGTSIDTWLAKIFHLTCSERYSRYRGRVSEESAVLDTLPKFLRMDIAKHNNSGIIHEVPLFSHCDDHFCRELALQLKPEFFLPGVDLIMEGEMGNEMFFQSHGTSIVIKNKVKVDTMYKGAFFGEIALILARPRTASIRASTSVEVYKLSKIDFEDTLRQYPGIRATIRRAAIDRYRHSSSSSTVMLIQRFAAELESAGSAK